MKMKDNILDVSRTLVKDEVYSFSNRNDAQLLLLFFLSELFIVEPATWHRIRGKIVNMRLLLHVLYICVWVCMPACLGW